MKNTINKQVVVAIYRCRKRQNLIRWHLSKSWDLRSHVSRNRSRREAPIFIEPLHGEPLLNA